MLAVRPVRLAPIMLLTLAAWAGPAPGPTPSPVLVASAAEAGPAAEDAGLLAAMRQAYLDLTGERARARHLLGELNAARYDEKLAARARQKDETGIRAERARQALVEAWSRLFAAVGGPQPVDPRMACRLQERSLREAMSASPGSAAPARLERARGEARDCLTRLAGPLDQARVAGRALDLAVAEAKAALGAAPPPPSGAP